ncbi:hypothetical protein DBB29_10810 [Pandoraea cepalis]|uniref:Oligosaccharide repeat unit polymerase n=1 Tax=Pandoraea cepalis TaxID=2508294 RepID=A0AAW7MU74_9BURK|nr:O-antigen polymerase [Pandoraea cepalis]MDN4576467.1 hypothetical protein [Pandoraea cepalis]MDN4578603.1 hypothetical protein [Pandoraea cepalis]
MVKPVTTDVPISDETKQASARRLGALEWIVDVRSSGMVFPLMIMIGYSLVPLVVSLAFYDYPYLLELSLLSIVSALCIFVGSITPIFDPFVSRHRRRLVLSEKGFIWPVWFAFACFAILAWATAQRIPIVAAIAGADPATLAELRERFLKAREGWQHSFVYINALFTGALIPYCLARMFLSRMRGRWLAVAFFFFYSISFLEKAFFLKAVIPLFYLVVVGQIRSRIRPGSLLMLMIGTVVLMAVISGAGESGVVSTGSFFTPNYVPSSPLEHVVWRSVVIPMVTAADGLRLFNAQFGGSSLDGATSSFLAGLTGQTRIPFEQLVFALQWGQNETGTGSANSVFIIESYVNFGIFGVIFFSLMAGCILRLLVRSRDVAAGACWLLFAVGLYTAGLIGTMLSNGFIVLLMIIVFVRLKPSKGMSRTV